VKKWLGGYWPTAAVLARTDWVKAHPKETQAVVNAMVATMRWINTHSAAQIADHLPADFVSNQLSTKDEYVKALTMDKGQFLPDGLMPQDGPQTVLAVEEERWEDNRMIFRVRALGQAASGHVDVADDHVRLEVTLPWLLQRFAEAAQAAIQNRGRLLLTKR